MYISHIYENKNLSTIIKKFGNSTIDNCTFHNTNILCYENHTCDSIYVYNEYIPNDEAEKYYKLCTKEDIDKYLSQQKNKSDTKSNSLFIFISGIVIGCVSVFLIN